MTFSDCSRCNTFFFSRDGGGCGCTQFTIEDEDGDETTIWARGDEEMAAIKYAEETDGPNDNYILDSDGVVIKVNGQKFTLTAEPTINYYASED